MLGAPPSRSIASWTALPTFRGALSVTGAADMSVREVKGRCSGERGIQRAARSQRLKRLLSSARKLEAEKGGSPLLPPALLTLFLHFVHYTNQLNSISGEVLCSLSTPLHLLRPTLLLPPPPIASRPAAVAATPAQLQRGTATIHLQITAFSVPVPAPLESESLTLALA
jgi:hypothetical protein